MSDLERLIEAVEAGREPTGLDVHKADTGHSDHIALVINAFNGSLDAAHALHEALLPGHGAVIQTFGFVRIYRDPVDDLPFSEADFVSHGTGQCCPARAWLLAILRAYAAQQEPTP